MARKTRLTTALSLALGMLVADPLSAKSESLCDGLKLALKNAEEKFVALRGPYDFDLTEYKANIRFGDAAACSTDSKDGVSELQCTQKFDELQEAQRVFANYMELIKQCFGRGVTLKRSSLPYHQWFRHEETTDDIEIRLGQLKARGGRPPRPYIQITINYIDPSAR